MKKIICMIMLGSTLGFCVVGDAIARVDGKKINPDYLNALIEKSYPDLRYETLSPEQQKEVLAQAVDKKLLAIEAKKIGLASSSKYEKAIEALTDDYLVAQLVKKELKDIVVSEEEIAKAYEVSKPMLPARLHVRQIVLTDKNVAQETLEKLQKLPSTQLLSSFEQEAKNSIDATTAQVGGDLQWVNKAEILPDFLQALNGLRDGELAKAIVRGEKGWHIFYLQESIDSKQATLQESKMGLERVVKAQKLRAVMDEKRNQLSKKYKVEIVK